MRHFEKTWKIFEDLSKWAQKQRSHEKRSKKVDSKYEKINFYDHLNNGR